MSFNFTKKEMEAVGILSIGTFLEYFDFYLFIHIGVLLNSAFFEQGDAQSKALVTAIGLSTSFVFRPIGALIFGYIGDRYGRLTTLFLTMTLMCIASIGIYILPTYVEIGIIASYLVSLFRILQGMSTLGEIVGAEVYIVELLKGKKAYIGTALLNVFVGLGAQFAVIICYFAINGYIEWRNTFLVGMFVMFIGSVARRKLIEVKDFTEAQKNTKIENVHVSIATYYHSFILECMQPIIWFIVYVGFNNVLRSRFGYTEQDIIKNSFILGFACVAYQCVAVYFQTKYKPIILTKVRNTVTISLLFLSPLALFEQATSEIIVVHQTLLLFFGISDCGIIPLVYKNIPMLKRFTAAAFTFSAGRAFVALITSFSITIYMNYLGIYAFMAMGLPFAILYLFSLRYFEMLDEKSKDGQNVHYQ